jgi:hypothetical protein
MVIREDPSLTPAEVANIITSTARGWPSRTDQLGYGVVDAAKAVEAAQVPGCVPNSSGGLGPFSQIVLSPDISGDGRGDVVGVDANDRLLAYPASTTGSLSSPIQLHGAFAGNTAYAPGDWNKDGKTDVLARDSGGFLYQYSKGLVSNCLSVKRQIGNGWTGYKVIPVGDITSDGNNDLLAIKESNGDLMLYAGTGTGGFKSPYPKVGNGWTGWQLYAAGDANKDGKRDIFGVDSSGKLFLYKGLGNGLFATKVQVGSGWGGYLLATGADLNGDGTMDVAGRDNSSRALYFYRGKGDGTFWTKVQIGSGW